MNPPGALLGLVVLLVPAGTAEEYHQQNSHHNPYLQYVARNAQVQWALGGAISHLLVDLAVSFRVEEEACGQRMLRAEVPLASLAATDNNR